MTKYNILNVRMASSPLNKLKSGIKNGTEVTLNLSSNVIGDSNDETNFADKLLLMTHKFGGFTKLFANSSSVNIKLLKKQLSKMVQLEGSSLPAFGLLVSFPPFNMINSLANAYGKESNNTGHKEINTNLLVDTGYNIIDEKIKKGISSITGSGITLTNNEIKDIIKVIVGLSKNRGILLKGTTTKLSSQEGGFLNVLRPLM